MFDKYSYKQKYFALWILFIVLSITAYKRSFKNLIEVINENFRLKELNEEVNLKTKNITNLTNQIANYNKYLGNDQNKENVQQELIAFISKYENISIFNFEKVHILNNENYLIHTNQIEITGSFNELIKLLYEFELNFKSAKVVNSKFYTFAKNNKTKSLHLIIIFQNYEIAINK